MNNRRWEPRQLKEIELELFDCFVYVCEKLNINYYVIGGTLLGAVRHKGFIPWDDDIDVGMLRRDYDVLLEHGQEFLPNEFFIQTYKTDPSYPTYFAKLRKSDTTFIEVSTSKLKINHGVYMDIFPLDYYSENKYAQLLWNIKSRFINARLSQEFVRNTVCPINEKIIEKISKIIYKTTADALESCDCALKKNSKSPLIRNYFGAWGEREIWPLEWFSQRVELEFEKRKVYAPKGWKELLSFVYGDYIQLPPKDQQITHHSTIYIDLEHSYKEYQNDDC